MIKIATIYIEHDISNISTFYRNKYKCFAKVNGHWYNTLEWKRINYTLSEVFEEYTNKCIYFKA